VRDHLGDSSVAIEARREIPAILVKVGTPAAANVLMENLMESDTTLRFRIISALNKLCGLHPEIETDVQTVGDGLSCRDSGALPLIPDSGQDQRHRGQSRSGSARIDGVHPSRIGAHLPSARPVYPHLDLHAAYLGLQSKSVAVHDNALEFLDNVFKIQLRDMLVPLLDGKITVGERAHLGIGWYVPKSTTVNMQWRHWSTATIPG